jgi:hypothetical protein
VIANRHRRYRRRTYDDEAVRQMNGKSHFMVCIRNDGYEGELELRKLYEVIADPSAARHAQVRVVDESGEDYLVSRCVVSARGSFGDG